MTWAKIESGNVVKMYSHPVQINKGDLVYSKKVFSDAEALKNLDILPVVFSGAVKSSVFYDNSESSPEVKGDAVVITRTSSEKEVAVIKAEMKERINQRLASFLSQTDWIIIRKADTGKEPPSKLAAWRTALREKAVELEGLIDSKNAASDLEALVTLTKAEADAGKKVATFHDWPEAEE